MPVKLYHNFYTRPLLAISSIVSGYLALVLMDNLSHHKHITSCVFKLITGIPCPGCGMGRATLSILKGDLVASFNYNILCIPFTLAVVAAFSWLLSDAIKRKETFFQFIKTDFRIEYKVLLATIIVIDWAVNIIRQV